MTTQQYLYQEHSVKVGESVIKFHSFILAVRCAIESNGILLTPIHSM